MQRGRPGEVTIRHVRSHIKVPGNEIADFLADAGASDMLLPGQRVDAAMREAVTWTRAWLVTSITHANTPDRTPVRIVRYLTEHNVYGQDAHV